MSRVRRPVSDFAQKYPELDLRVESYSNAEIVSLMSEKTNANIDLFNYMLERDIDPVILGSDAVIFWLGAKNINILKYLIDNNSMDFNDRKIQNIASILIGSWVEGRVYLGPWS